MVNAKEVAKLMACGYLTMCSNKSWTWWYNKPSLDKDGHWYDKQSMRSFGKTPRYPTNLGVMFNIEPVEDYRKSLIKCGK